MTLLDTAILTCPECAKYVQTIEVLSFHIFESVVFSDGKADTTPIMPNTSRILICPECRKEFWLEDAKQVLNEDLNLEKIKHIVHPSDLFSVKNSDDLLGLANYYQQLLDNNFAKNRQNESYLRVKLWHELNDIVRYNIPVKLKILEEREKMNEVNLVNLVKIFNPVYVEEKLMQAEMYRELGEFDFAIELLNEINDDFVDDKKLQLLSACKKKNKQVFKLKND